MLKPYGDYYVMPATYRAHLGAWQVVRNARKTFDATTEELRDSHPSEQWERMQPKALPLLGVVCSRAYSEVVACILRNPLTREVLVVFAG